MPREESSAAALQCAPFSQIKDTFRELLDAKRILRELRLLQHLGGHENLIWVLDIMVRIAP